MAKQSKTQKLGDATTTAVVVGDVTKDQGGLSRQHKKEMLIGGIGVLLVIGGGFLASVLYQSQRIPSPIEIIKAQSSGDNHQAEYLLKKAIANSDSKGAKANLTVQLGAMYSNDNNPRAAIAAYQQAAIINGLTSNEAKLLGGIYLEQGNNAKAVEYYQKTIDLWPKDDPLHDAEVKSYQQEIASLQGNPSK